MFWVVLQGRRNLREKQILMIFVYTANGRVIHVLRHNPPTGLQIWDSHRLSDLLFQTFITSLLLGRFILNFCFSYFSAFIQINLLQGLDCPLKTNRAKCTKWHCDIERTWYWILEIYSVWLLVFSEAGEWGWENKRVDLKCQRGRKRVEIGETNEQRRTNSSITKRLHIPELQ